MEIINNYRTSCLIS